MSMDASQFIVATDGKAFYMESFLKSILFAYQQLIDSKAPYSRKEIHDIMIRIHENEKTHLELEDFLCTDLVNKYVKPNLYKFGLEAFVVNTGVRETKENVTVGNLDIKFEVPSLKNNYYYAFEAKRLDESASRRNYYIDHGVRRFTDRIYYPESDTVVAGMIGFVEFDSNKKKPKRLDLGDIVNDLNALIQTKAKIITTQILKSHMISEVNHACVRDFKHLYISRHKRAGDNNEMSIYHVILDYYDLLSS
jgi:hypothetical protein